MAVLRILLQVLSLCAMACCFPFYQVADLDQVFGKALDKVFTPLEPQQSDNALHYAKQAQDIHVEGSGTIAKAMYIGLSDVIGNMLKMLSDKVAEVKSVKLDKIATT